MMPQRLPLATTAGGVRPAELVEPAADSARQVCAADAAWGSVSDPNQVAVRLSALRRLYRLIGRVNGARRLPDVLQSVVDGVVEGLGFGVAAVNLAHEDASFEVVAVAGSEEARLELVGQRNPASAFDAQFAAAEHWGTLRFVPHGRLLDEEMPGWVPDPAEHPAVHGADAWHPFDALFAPMSAPSGQLVGILSVDLPQGGRRPGALQCELLEMYAAQAGIAVDNARLGERLRASEAAFRLAFDGAACGMTMTGLDPRDPGRLLRVNRAMCDLLGYSAAELTAMTVVEITHPDDRGPSISALRAAAAGLTSADRAEKRYIRRDGSHVWVAITASVIQLESGETLHSITQIEDITTRKAADAELARRASHDPLTGLLNRTGLHESLMDALAAATDVRRGPAGRQDDPPHGALLYCDLDGFKSINDTHGHAFGDQVLRIVAARLTEQVRDADSVARLGGDEFVIVAARTTLAEAVALAARVERSVAAPLDVVGVAITTTVSVGIASLGDLPGDRRSSRAEDVDALLHLADTAMYQAKADGRDGHVVHSPLPAGRLAGRP
jgi:diguanylate cyclase (GGDEF)-like protein/PAS domain S-box-containing protein